MAAALVARAYACARPGVRDSGVVRATTTETVQDKEAVPTP
ncbi:hypothetical protein [Streptomyces albireticuli]|nr:hypothetical protein [Streptomyces albireticuli]